MVIIYDLRVLPATFDFADFCCLAYGLALKQKIVNPRFTPVIVTGKTRRVVKERRDFANTRDDDEISKRLYKIILPLVQMLPFLDPPLVLNSSCEDIDYNLKGKIFFPRKYSYDKPELYKYYNNLITNDLKCI